MNPLPAFYRRKRQSLTVAAILAASLMLLWIALPHVPNPRFEGRPVSFWFDDLCTGVFPGPRQASSFPKAFDAFTRMGPGAVPYLTNRLRYGRSGQVEKALLKMRSISFIAPLVKNVILPSTRRAYAATALRQMGPSAEGALPALLEAWKNDPDASLKPGAIAAMVAILYGVPPADMPMSDWQGLEAKVLVDAARKCPEAARGLGTPQTPTPATETRTTVNPGIFPKTFPGKKPL